jgi:hypothetical protein
MHLLQLMPLLAPEIGTVCWTHNDYLHCVLIVSYLPWCGKLAGLLCQSCCPQTQLLRTSDP